MVISKTGKDRIFRKGRIMIHLRQSVRLGVSLSALAFSVAAAAQTSTVPTDPVDAAPAQSTVETQDPAQDDVSSGGVQEIIVTAQRRAQNQQDVPIAITTVTAEAADAMGVVGTESLGIAVPSLQFSRQTGNGGTPFIRGVGSTQAAAGSEAPVALYVDDVYVGSANATLMQFNNIESTEVLKGPQGTLFGRNATGGVVHIRTKRPSQTFEMSATAGGGSYDTYFGNMYVTGGLTDSVAVSFAAAGQNQEKGYGRNLVTGDDTLKGWNYGFRGQLLWEPDSATSLMLTADYMKNKSDHGMSVVLAPGTIGTGGGRHVDPFGTYNTPADYSENEVWGISGKLDHDFGDFSLVWISAYRNATQRYRLDADSSPTGAQIVAVDISEPFTRTFSQEVQVVSAHSGPFQWILGGFYYRSEAGFDPLTYRGAAFAGFGGSYQVRDIQKLDSYAGFGEANYEFLRDTKLTLGLRYTRDSFNNFVRMNDAAGLPLPNTPFQQTSSFPKLTYRAILDHKVTPDILIYGSYSRGFKSGGYNLSAPTLGAGAGRVPAPVVEPEVLDAFEIGIKSELFNRMLRLNVAAFHYKYDNLQVTNIQNSTSITLNAAAAKVDGIDFDFSFVPTSRFSITGGASFLDSRFSSFPDGPLFVPNPATCNPPATTGPLTGGNTTCVADLTGFRTSRAPKFTGSIAANYVLPTNVGDFGVNASLYHNSGFFWEPDNRYAQPKYDLVGLTLSWTSPDQRYNVKVYGRNLLDEYYYSYFSESSGRDSGSPEMPRNYGASLTVRF